jgi:hypothetical protein
MLLFLILRVGPLFTTAEVPLNHLRRNLISTEFRQEFNPAITKGVE